MKAFLGGIYDFYKKLNDYKLYRQRIQAERLIRSDFQIIKEIIASQNFEINFKKNWQKKYQKILEEKVKEEAKNLQVSFQI